MDSKEDFTSVKSSLVHLHSDSDLPTFLSRNDFCHSFITESNLFQKPCDWIKKEKSKAASLYHQGTQTHSFAAGQQFDPVSAAFRYSFFPQNLTYPIEIYYLLVGH